MDMRRLAEARLQLDEAILHLEGSLQTWSECVTSLHLAEVNLRLAQRQMRKSYDMVAEILSENGG